MQGFVVEQCILFCLSVVNVTCYLFYQEKFFHYISEITCCKVGLNTDCCGNKILTIKENLQVAL